MNDASSNAPDEETVVRPRVPRAQTTDADGSSIDADTVIRVPPPTAPTPHAPTPHAQTQRSPTRAASSALGTAVPASAAPAPPPLVEPAEPVAASIDEVLHPPLPSTRARDRVFAYGFRVNNGRAVSLEAPVLIGRAPTPPRILTAERPVLARVESPHKEVSGTHLELRQQGTLVIATDLRSTNGTTVTPPGRETQKLRQGESVVVQPGTVIDIGDGNLVEILPLQSRESD